MISTDVEARIAASRTHVSVGDPVDEVLPLSRLIPLGLQHVLVM
jgi:hypothetical protein